VIASVVLLGLVLVIAAVIVVGVRATAGSRDTEVGAAPQTSARRVVVFILLFALVVIAAIGLSGLVGRLLGSSDILISDDVTGLARSLAFTLIAGPLAAVLWWTQWRRLRGGERASVSWGLYLAAMSTVSLVTAAVALLTGLAVLVRGEWQPQAIATGIVWAGVWAWHRWMLRHRDKSPVRLVTTAPVIGWVFGLLLAAGGAITMLSSLVDAAVESLLTPVSVGDPWWILSVQALIWLLGGGIVWWWHWYHDGARALLGGLADVALVVVGTTLAAIVGVAGLATTLFVVLRLMLDPSEAVGLIVEPLGVAVGAALIGPLVWRYHHGRLHSRRHTTRLAAGVLAAGVGVVAAASGLGVIVNAVLAGVTPSLVGSDARTLLLGGLSALLVGGPVWWVAWKPTTVVDAATAASAVRRLYLIIVFGLSAVVAIITLLVIGYRIFEYVLGDVPGAGLLDRVRAPLGLLAATGLVAAYHFVVWKRDRSLIAATPRSEPRIARVILVTEVDPGPLAQAVTDATGAAVTVWRATASRESGAAATPEQLAEALANVVAQRVLVVMGPEDRIDVIPLQDKD